MQDYHQLRRRERDDEGVSCVLNGPGGDTGLLQREEPRDHLSVCRDTTERFCQGSFCPGECVLPTLRHRSYHVAGRAWARWSDAISSISAWNDGHSGNPPAAA